MPEKENNKTEKKRLPARRGKSTTKKAGEQAENRKMELPQEQEKATPKKQTHRRKPSTSKKTAAAKETEPQVLEVVSEPGEKKQSKRSSKKKSAKNTATDINEVRRTPLRIVPLGGLNEIGKNMTLYECVNDMFIVDCGSSFPDEEMLGVDLVIPDFSYVEKNKDKIRGIVITHGHEDHIGAIPYLLKTVNIPVYGTRLTLGILEGKLKEHDLLGKVKLNVVKPKDIIKLGCMAVEFIHVNHSIPDACALAIHTPAGVVVQTGDFKVDFTPIESGVIDLARFGELGNRGVLALLCDSTNAERPGHSLSESKVGESFNKLFSRAGNRRIIIATFSSNVHRIQQIVDYSHKYGKKVALSGRSMLNVVAKAIELGYLRVPDGLLIDIDAIRHYPANKVVIITTGSQGEPMSALTRMAMGEHRKVNVTPNDFIIISATPIPGNEKTVGRVINELLKLGAEVVYEAMYETHASGHASQEELKLMMSLVRPKFFVPVHGEFKHLKKNASLASSMGIPSERILLGDIGKVMETDGVDMKFVGSVPAGQVFVDGLGVGDVGSIVLRDRKHLSEDGLIIAVVAIDSVSGQIAAGPDVISRGFVYVREAEHMMAEAREIVRRCVEECANNGLNDWGHMKTVIKDKLSSYLYNQTKRSPMILPVIQEI